jgi:type 1 glutamine amidotransferase
MTTPPFRTHDWPAAGDGVFSMMRWPLWSALASALAMLAILSPTRTRSADPDPETPPIRALLVIGGCCHDYERQKDIITKGISARANVQWAIAYDPDKGTRHKNPVYNNADWAKGFDVVVHDECCADVKDLETINRILEPHRKGLPSVVLHCAMHSYRSEGWPKAVIPWFEFTGLQTTGHGDQLPIAMAYVDKDSPITKGLPDWKTDREELYNNITGKLLETAHPLATGKQGTTECVVTWTNLYKGKTRVFGTTLGHNNTTVGDPRYLDLVTRGLLWSVDKLDEAHLKPAKRVLLDESPPK